MRKQAVIDIEKRAHIVAMRKAGVTTRDRPGEVPFGIRALQSGVEIPGIWIAPPSSPRELIRRA